MKIEFADGFDREATFLSVDGRVIEIPSQIHIIGGASFYTELYPEQAVDKITRQKISDEIMGAIIEHIKTEMIDHRYELHLHDGTVITRRKMVDKVQSLGEENGKRLFQIDYLNGYDSDNVVVPIKMQSVDKSNPDKIAPKLLIGDARRKVSGLPVDDLIVDALRQYIRKEYEDKDDWRTYVALYNGYGY